MQFPFQKYCWKFYTISRSKVIFSFFFFRIFAKISLTINCVKTIHNIKILREPVFRKVFGDFFDISFFCSLYTKNNFFTSDFYETQNNEKNYSPKELNGNLTQIKPTNTNRSSVEHKVALILSFRLFSNIFQILLHIFWRAAIWIIVL
jgi:hypothetical protein